MNRETYRLKFDMKAEGDEAEVMIYSSIEQYKWYEDDVTPGDFDKALKEARKNGAKKLNLRINSPGGDVYSAVAMRSMVINAGFDDVRVMIEGLCASAATLFVTIPDARVVIAEGSEFMIHNPMTIAWGNADEIEATVDHLRKMEGSFREMYAAKTGYSEDEIKEWMDAETWFTAKEAVVNGFADEMLETERIAAQVTQKGMAVMRAMYRSVPDDITVREDEGSNDAPVAKAPSVIEIKEDKNEMEIGELTIEQLRADRPELVNEIQNEAVRAERQRMEDIDAITMPGYEDMAAEAKANGTSVIDFQKNVVKAMREKGAAFIAQRQEETKPAQNVGAGAPQDKTDDDDIRANAEAMAKLAKEYSGSADGGMY